MTKEFPCNTCGGSYSADVPAPAEMTADDWQRLQDATTDHKESHADSLKVGVAPMTPAASRAWRQARSRDR